MRAGFSNPSRNRHALMQEFRRPRDCLASWSVLPPSSLERACVASTCSRHFVFEKLVPSGGHSMFSFKAVLIAAGLAVVSTSALALPTVPSQPAPGPIPQPSTGNGGLLLSIYDTDPSRPRSLVTSLGLNFQVICPPT
jgi:hypothetical protein